MLFVISPAKTLDFESAAPLASSQPLLAEETLILVEYLRALSATALGKLFAVSEKLAQLNWERYQGFEQAAQRPALWAFKGDVYQGLEVETLPQEAVAYCAAHLRMLSGLYGVLRPTDAIAPHRLEMGTALNTDKGKSLYAFWANKITQTLNTMLEESGASHLINLASEEYYKSVQEAALIRPVIQVKFLEAKGGKYQTIGVHAKRARGLMCRFAALNGLEKPEDLKAFNWENYTFRADLSEANAWAFARG
jgi:cytoplasmic iron level regulating protein YaaA (DUF328/UPF0246 family)